MSPNEEHHSVPTPLPVDSLLGPLETHLDRGELAYRSYLDGGRTFFWARVLRENNDGVRRLLLTHTHRLPDDLRADALALLHHLDVWSAQWDQLATEAAPAPDDTFVFQTRVRFPAEAVQRLRDAARSGAD